MRPRGARTRQDEPVTAFDELRRYAIRQARRIAADSSHPRNAAAVRYLEELEAGNAEI